MGTTKKKKVSVIGGGLGGISAAISLANEGYQVELYEKNNHLGGKLNQATIDGFTFDLGPSILTMPHIFEDLFKQADKEMSDYVNIKKLDLQWRNFFEDGIQIDLYEDVEKLDRVNPQLELKDKQELKEFLDYAEDIYEVVEEGYFKEGIDTLFEALKFYGLITSVKGLDYFSTMHDGVSRYIDNPYLQHVIEFFIKYVGSSPYDAPAVLNLLPYIQFEYGLWYVEGGMYNLAQGLAELMNDLGVAINLNSEVVDLHEQDNSISQVELKDGTVKETDIVVSNMEVIPAYEELLGGNEKLVKKYKKKFEPACSGLVIHLGVDKEYEQLEHHNFFFSQEPREHFKSVFEDKKLPKDPTLYVVAATKTDAAQAPEGCENIKVLPHIPHLQDDPFTAEEYEALKERVLDKLERMGLEDLREHIIVEDIWTPEDIQSNYYSNRGAIYGVVSDRKMNKGFKAPKQSKNYDNLYFVGGSVNPGGGMPMVTLSGQQVRDMIVKHNK
mgnify:CR=1 FL=1